VWYLLSETLKDNRIDPDHIVENVVYAKNDSLAEEANGRKPMSIYIFFDQQASETQVNDLVGSRIMPLLGDRMNEFFDQTPQTRFDYNIAKPQGGGFVAKITAAGIARHPAQLYESISCLILFLFLLWIWSRKKQNLVAGRIFGIFLIWCFGMRFMFEFLKENQEAFEDKLPLNMGQILSIPLVVAGIIILLLTFRKKELKNS
jgi:prolipoprotein diacylglyceryltransferase